MSDVIGAPTESEKNAENLLWQDMTTAEILTAVRRSLARLTSGRDRHSLQAELNRRHNHGEMPDVRGGWRAYNTAIHEVRRRLLGIDGPNSWGGCPKETQERLIRYIVAHRAYPQPRLP